MVLVHNLSREGFYLRMKDHGYLEKSNKQTFHRYTSVHSHNNNIDAKKVYNTFFIPAILNFVILSYAFV